MVPSSSVCLWQLDRYVWFGLVLKIFNKGAYFTFYTIFHKALNLFKFNVKSRLYSLLEHTSHKQWGYRFSLKETKGYFERARIHEIESDVQCNPLHPYVTSDIPKKTNQITLIFFVMVSNIQINALFVKSKISKSHIIHGYRIHFCSKNCSVWIYRRCFDDCLVKDKLDSVILFNSVCSISIYDYD